MSIAQRMTNQIEVEIGRPAVMNKRPLEVGQNTSSCHGIAASFLMNQIIG
jgi:hypothetical protein